jgi:hypothetical protein
MSDKVISTSVQDGGYPCFVPERPEPADEVEIGTVGKKHDARTSHIKQGNAMRPDKPARESR